MIDEKKFKRSIEEVRQELESNNKHQLEKISDYIYVERDEKIRKPNEELADTVIRLLQEKDERIAKLEKDNLELLKDKHKQDTAIKVLADKID